MHDIQYRPFNVDDMTAVCELLNLANASDGEQMNMQVEELIEDIGPPAVEVASDTLAATLDASRTRHRYQADVENARRHPISSHACPTCMTSP